MSWAKLDDRFHENPKIRASWLRQASPLGLYVLALTYCAGNETDGFVDNYFVMEKVQNAPLRRKLVDALVEDGLWTAEDGGWRIHDYLDFHPSKAELDEKRAKDSERKARGRANGAHAPSKRTPAGIHEESKRSPSGIRAVSNGPDPTRPDPERDTA
jgi:hypothetical protein